MTNRAPKAALSEPNLFSRALQFVVFLGNVCGNGPFSFRFVALIALCGSYAIVSSPLALVCGLILNIILYYTLIGLHRVLVYNRYLDPLLAIPGPKASFHQLT